MEGEFIGPLPPASSPSQTVVSNGGNTSVAGNTTGAGPSSGSGGSRTNTPPSPQTTVSSTAFPPSMPPYALYHPIPPPFMLPPHMLPHGPIPGHPYPGVQVVDGSQFSQNQPPSSSSPGHMRYHYVQRTSQHPKSGEEDNDEQQGEMYETAPVIIFGSAGNPILVHDVSNYEMPHYHGGNGSYDPNDEMNIGGGDNQQQSHQRSNGKLSFQQQQKRWRKQPPHNVPQQQMPRLRRQAFDQDSKVRHDGGIDDSSSTGSGAISSSPRPRGNSFDHKNSKQQKQQNGDSAGENAAPEQTSAEELERQRLIELIQQALSNLGPPKLVKVTATSLTVEMAPLPLDEVITATGLTDATEIESAKKCVAYDIALSVPQRPDELDNIYTGEAAEVNVVDLKPGTHYSLGVAAVYTGPPVASASSPVRGPALPLLNFQTLCSVPEKPEPPKLANKNAVKAASLNLRWSPPASDNGAPLTAYILEWRPGHSLQDPNQQPQKNFSKLFQCAPDTRIYRLTNLQPATTYSFRLAAVNELGQSPYSDEVNYRTSGAPPPAPTPPTLKKAFVDSLTLQWSQEIGGAISLSPTEFNLQMDDIISGHGFLNVYRGADSSEFTIKPLRRNSEYRFRLAAINEDGQSKWSEPVVSFHTLPDSPKPPMRLIVKASSSKSGQSLSANSVRLCWEPPKDDGGLPVERYEIQTLESVHAGEQHEAAQPVFVSSRDRETLIEGLQPGRAYQCRIRAHGPGGVSDWSDPVIACTAATCPHACTQVPTAVGKSRPTSVTIKWSPPSYDGGAQISSYEVRCAKIIDAKLQSPHALQDADIEEWTTCYEGPELSCNVQNLLPGRHYVFQVRAFNRVGAGPWFPMVPSSDVLSFITTAPSAPETPAAPMCQPSSSFSVTISWTEPDLNGSRITEYRLEMSKVSSDSSPSFVVIYHGSHLNFDAKQLEPATQYQFRLQAVNQAGSSSYSPVVLCETPPATPAAPLNVCATGLSTSSMLVEWQAPNDHGSPILSYSISLSPGDRTINVPCVPQSPSPIENEESDERDEEMENQIQEQQHFEYTVEDLEPDTIYSVKVQAVNRLGAGQFSSLVKGTTPPLPPSPPELEVSEATHNMLRIKWQAVPQASTVIPGTDLVEYTLLMDRPNAPMRLQPVYTGPALSYRAKNLQERTTYRFAIQAKTQSGGVGPQSAVPKAFTTLPTPPNVPSGLHVMSSNNNERIAAEWRPSQTNHAWPIEYILQLQTQVNPQWQVIYRGADHSVLLPNSSLESGTCQLRVAASYVLDGDQIVTANRHQSSSFTQPVSFKVAKVDANCCHLLPAGAELPHHRSDKVCFTVLLN